MTKLDGSILIVAAGTLGAALLMSPAYAFNPQPDPPAHQLAFSKTFTSGGTSGWHGVSPGPCKARGRCQAPHTQKAGQ